MTALCSSARNIRATLGMRAAAGYLRKRGVNLDTAVLWLLGVRAYHQLVDREAR